MSYVKVDHNTTLAIAAQNEFNSILKIDKLEKVPIFFVLA
jgi:hypothetical protein